MRSAFTLVEIAIVLVIVSFLIAMGIGTFGRVSEGEKYKMTRLYLQKLPSSALNYAFANGRLPCPDITCDGYEDRCDKEEGCDIDEDGEVDLEHGRCMAEYYYRKQEPVKNSRCGDFDFSRGKNTPPYLLPYATLGERRDDGFGKPIRYDVNYHLAAASDLEHLCMLGAFLSNKTTINTSKEINSTYYLPIATNQKDTKDDELIAPQSGYSVGAVFISQGECVGVSGKNAGSNQEYAASQVEISGQDCSEKSYSDLTHTMSFNQLMEGACKITFPKKFNFFIRTPSGSFKINTGSKWECYDWSDFDHEKPSGIAWFFSHTTSDSVRFFEEKGCDGDPILLAQVIERIRQGAALEDEGIENGSYLFIPLLSALAAHMEDEDGDLVCTDLSEVSSVVYAIDANLDKIFFYSSMDDCKEDVDPIASLAQLRNRDLNKDKIVAIGSEGALDNRFTKVELILAKETSYLDDNGCHNVTETNGKIKVVDFYQNPFIVFDAPDCDSDRAYLLSDVITISIRQNNTGQCKLEKDSPIDCTL
ncbi:MAG: type II secretion system protein [Epsilonproteobacteria bacterium]|nr:type II secretion system protein [Campylobacterota bacterium]